MKNNFKYILYALSICSLLLALHDASRLDLILDQGMQTYFDLLLIPVGVLFFLYIEPKASLSLLALSFIAYLFYYQFFNFIPLVSIFLILNFISSWFLSSKFVGELKQERIEFRVIFTIITFISLLYFQSFILLALKSLYAINLLMISTVITALSYCYRDKMNNDMLELKSYFSNTKCEQFYAAALISLFVFFGFMYLYPGVLAGDSDKAYLAIARYFVRENYILLSDPEILRDDMRGFPYMQELYFAAGYALNGHFGAKLLAFLLPIFKLIILFFVCFRKLNFTVVHSIFVVLSYALIPILLELSCTERPENSLIIFSLTLFYLLESQKLFSIEKLAAAVFAVICLAFGTKYTAFYLSTAFVLVYYKFFIASIKNLKNILFKYWPTILVFGSLTLFWYLRNLILWGEVVTLKPFSKYHLTVHFPPLRSFEDLYSFISSSLIHSSTYTEYNNLAYGLFSFLIYPAIFYGLSSSGVKKRSALLFFIYAFCLLASTRQIRYLAPVAHFPIFITCALLFSRNISKTVLFILLAIQLSISTIVNQRQIVGAGLSQRTNLTHKDFSRDEPVFSKINDRVKYPNVIITSAYDANYSIDAKLLRVDPLWSIKDLQEKIKLGSHVLLAGPDRTVYLFPFFNDLAFFEAIFEQEVYSSHLFLFKMKNNRLNELASYCKTRGWDLSKTVIVSENLKNKFPLDLIVGEEVMLPNLRHRLYRLVGTFENNKDYGQSKEFLPGKLIASYQATSENKQLNAVISSNNIEISKSIIAKKKDLTRNSFINYEFEINENDNIVLEVYAKYLSVVPEKLKIANDNMTLPVSYSDYYWIPVFQKEFSNLNQKVNLEFEINSAQFVLKDMAVVIRKPHQQFTKLPFAEELLSTGKLIIDKKEVFYLYEDFKTGLKASRELRNHSERKNVKVKDSSMVLEQKKEIGYKRYFLKAPKEKAVKLFIKGSGDFELNIKGDDLSYNRDFKNSAFVENTLVFEKSSLSKEDFELKLLLGENAQIDDLILFFGSSDKNP